MLVVFRFVGQFNSVVGEWSNAQNERGFAVDTPTLRVLQDRMHHSSAFQKDGQTV